MPVRFLDNRGSIGDIHEITYEECKGLVYNDRAAVDKAVATAALAAYEQDSGNLDPRIPDALEGGNPDPERVAKMDRIMELAIQALKEGRIEEQGMISHSKQGTKPGYKITRKKAD